MTKFIRYFILLISLGYSSGIRAGELKCGAEQPDKYLALIHDKKVGLVVNHTSLAGEIHLVDFLLEKKVNVKKIFAPEHGFRGEAAPGEEIKAGVDGKTGIPVLSLYGETRKPTQEQLAGIDLMVFDIQDVGCRFYTYISTLHLVIEACAENNVPLIVFDRPNPNGDYVAGPVLKKEFQSFVGMDQIPVVHGCTVGELANMINGERWHKANKKCDLKVIQVENYDHKLSYSLPVAPSPNLPNDLSVRLYPSLCFFEATSVSVGRGTDFPFQVLGGLDPQLGDFEFTPKTIPGVAVHPLNEGEKCYGIDLRSLKIVPVFTLKYFLDFYHCFVDEKDFVTRENWLNLLAGTDEFIQLVREGKNEREIKAHWQNELNTFKETRKKYLLYPDFQ
ncbi:exo-beta-N-acetylmuramidase NamZ family protein [Maribellus maritimus]|uniref:exo-beta-N-acetylmuramidase NamZ family protein n=1 Tax=Maribellus maritimus TaxID=2870838 RepID=UPI001EE9BD50|nr:DUF1343 domain-containing protein [Maribellus maritimus]MCG6185924.1 DUF1343 domain-containing protein [Maribellus maritimus]